MLVLTQREGEVLKVGDDVRIYIKRIRGNWVRLCIDAPPEVTLERIAAPEVEAAKAPVRPRSAMPDVIRTRAR
jgi:carbon storage regulator